MTTEPLLAVRGMRVEFSTLDGPLRAVDGVSYEVAPGRALGIVGESGSGKTVAALGVMGLAGLQGATVSGEVLFGGRDLLDASDDELRRVRGNEIAMIFQDPLSSLHPFYRVGRQIAEAIRAHRDVSREAARTRAVELLALVEIPDALRRVDAYPHELSGGMRQRAMIAMALANDPKLLIADEPTTALDVTVQAQILELLRRLQRELGMALVLITHDLGVIAETVDEVAVMYAGRIVERGPVQTLFQAPEHPYTWGLLGSIRASTYRGSGRSCRSPDDRRAWLGRRRAAASTRAAPTCASATDEPIQRSSPFRATNPTRSRASARPRSGAGCGRSCGRAARRPPRARRPGWRRTGCERPAPARGPRPREALPDRAWRDPPAGHRHRARS